MILHLGLPEQCTCGRIHPVGVGARIAKKHRKLVGTGNGGKTDCGSNDGFGFEHPAGASAFCVECVDLAVAAPHKYQSADNRWLGQLRQTCQKTRTPISAATTAPGLASIQPSRLAETGCCQDPHPSHSSADHRAPGRSRPGSVRTARNCRSERKGLPEAFAPIKDAIAVRSAFVSSCAMDAMLPVLSALTTCSRGIDLRTVRRGTRALASS